MIDPQAMIGLTLGGKYTVKRLMGIGGMGAVYEGTNIELGKRVAIKTIDRAHAQADELTARLRLEARAASAIESEHIVQIFDVADDARVGVFMVMEFLAGEDVSVRLQRERRLDPAVAATIAYQVARALSKAHAAGVIHRDLKPANLFLVARDDGSIFTKILDFGISKLIAETQLAGVRESQGLTRFGSAIGTPQYMSPEQAQGLTTIDHRSDVWALGCVLFEMIAGRPPYEEQQTYELTIVRILTTAPPSLLDLVPTAPPGIAALIDATLQHDWSRRLPDCATFARAILEATSGGGASDGGRISGAPLMTPVGGQPSPFLPGGPLAGMHPAPLIAAPSRNSATLIANPSPTDGRASLPSGADWKSTVPMTGERAAAYGVPAVSGFDRTIVASDFEAALPANAAPTTGAAFAMGGTSDRMSASPNASVDEVEPKPRSRGALLLVGLLLLAASAVVIAAVARKQGSAARTVAGPQLTQSVSPETIAAPEESASPHGSAVSATSVEPGAKPAPSASGAASVKRAVGLGVGVRAPSRAAGAVAAPPSGTSTLRPPEKKDPAGQFGGTGISEEY